MFIFYFSTQTFGLCNKTKTKSQSIHFHNTLTPRLKWQKRGGKKRGEENSKKMKSSPIWLCKENRRKGEKKTAKKMKSSPIWLCKENGVEKKHSGIHGNNFLCWCYKKMEQDKFIMHIYSFIPMNFSYTIKNNYKKS